MYAANLAQKARELKREKRKSDTLLFQMLPPSVAQQLKQTQQVNFQNYFNHLNQNLFKIENAILKILICIYTSLFIKLIFNLDFKFS